MTFSIPNSVRNKPKMPKDTLMPSIFTVTHRKVRQILTFERGVSGVSAMRYTVNNVALDVRVLSPVFD